MSNAVQVLVAFAVILDRNQIHFPESNNIFELITIVEEQVQFLFI